MYANAQSIASKLGELAATAKDLQPDLILLCETWCNDTVSNASLSIDDYRLETDLRCDRTDTKNGIGGGLLVYAKNELKILPCDSYSTSMFNQFCAFTIATRSEKLNVILCYRPPSSNPTNTAELCEILKRLKDNTILIGDINMPGIDWSEGRSDAKGRELLETTIEEGLQQLVSFPTHIKGNTLDLVITNCQEIILEICDEGRLGRSDHCMLSMVVECELQADREEGTRYVWGKANMAAISAGLDRTDWLKELRHRSVEEAWNYFKFTLDESVERNVPKGQPRTKFRHPWMTREILRLVRKKRRLWRTYKLTASRSDMEAYKKTEKETSKKIRNAKRKLERDLVRDVDKHNRKFTKYVKSKTKSKTTIGPLITKEKKILTEGKEMAEELNKFFASVFTIEDMQNLPDPEPELVGHQMSTIKVSEQDIQRKIRKLRKDAASGPDMLSPRLLQQLENSFLRPLSIIFNMSLESGTVPTAWKTATVTPIFKKGTKGDPGNYRPVSLTSVPCKILESIIKDKIMDHLLENNLISDSQHGFMPGRSCATNLVEFMDFVTESVDEGESVDIFYLDFAKAFDKVPRQRLLRKLRAKGVEPGAVTWIEDWLTGRTQCVQIQGEKSGECSVESGVPQGTVLGPCLFSVYIDDLEGELKQRRLDVLIKKFADDTKGAKVIKGPEDRIKMQEALDCLCDWADRWGMSFNFSKCKVMHVGKKNPRYEYFMRGTQVSTTEEERDVGVLISSNLKPSAQCSKAACTAKSVLNQLQRNFHYRDRITFLKLYKQYVRPHLEFSVPAWSPWLAGDREVLEKVQEKAVKMVTGLKAVSYEDRCAELGLETLQVRRERLDMALVHKYIGKENQTLFRMMSANGGARTRRAAGAKIIASQYARTDIRKESFAIRVVETWNRLPDSVKLTEKLESFKKKLNKTVT